MEVTLGPEEFDRFERSLERCLANDTFASRFYARLLLCNEEIASKFANTDLKKQATVLKQSLYMVMRAARGLDDGLAHLAQIARSHSARGLGIEERHYQLWLETLIAVMHETEPRYVRDLESLWRAVFQPCIDHMIRNGR